MKKLTLMLVLALVLCMGVWANGNAEKKEGVTITFQHSMVPVECNELLKQWAEEYKAETGVTVEVSYVPWESQRDKTLTSIAAGKAPDIIHGNSNQGAAEWVGLGAMADLTPFLSDKMKEELIPTAFDELGPYAIPFVQSPEAAIFYRPDMFKEAGVEAPAPGQAWTWDEFVEAAKKLTKDTNGDGIPEVYGFAERGLGFTATKSYIPHLWAYGADIIKKDASGKWVSGMGDQAAKDAVASQIALVKDSKVLDSGYITWGLPEAQRAWDNKEMAMFSVGYWWANTVATTFGDKYLVDYDAMPFPQEAGRFGFSTYDYFLIPAASKHQQEAYDFLEWIMLDTDRMVQLAVADMYLPPCTKSALADEHFSDEALPLWSERFALWADDSHFMPAYEKYTDLWASIVNPIWEEIETGRRTVADGVALMDKEITAYLEERQ